MTEHLPFLRIVWGLFTRHSTGEFPSTWVFNFVADRVIDELGDTVSFDRLVFVVEARNAVDESLDKTVLTLVRDWALLEVATKKDLIKSIKAFKLTDRFKSVLLDLTSEEKEALSIRWDISDILYFESKQKALQECRTRGLDLENNELDLSYHTFPNIVSDCREIIITLLKSKIQTDLAVVSIATPKNVAKYITVVSNRTYSEYLDLLTSFRKPIRACIGYFRLLDDDQSLWSGAEEMEVSWLTENSLKQFKKDFEVLKSKVSTLQPSPEIYNRVRGLIGTGRPDPDDIAEEEAEEATPKPSLREKFWMLTDSNLFWGGGIGLAGLAYSFEWAKAPARLTITMTAISWLIICVSIYRHRFFERWRPLGQIIFNFVVFLSIAVILVFLWVFCRAS